MSEGSSSAEPTPCDRCGIWAPLELHDGLLLCDACLERTRHEIETTSCSPGALIAGTAVLLRQVWAAALGLSVASSLFVIGANSLPVHNVVVKFFGWLTALVVAPLFSATIALVALATVRGEPATILAAARRAWPNAVTIVLASLARFAIVFVGTLLFVVPGLFAVLALVLVTPCAAAEPGKVRDALERSATRMGGHYLAAFVAFVVALLPAAVARAAIYFSPRFVPLPRATLLHVAHLAPIVQAPLAVPLTIMSVVLYVKTKPE